MILVQDVTSDNLHPSRLKINFISGGTNKSVQYYILIVSGVLYILPNNRFLISSNCFNGLGYSEKLENVCFDLLKHCKAVKHFFASVRDIVPDTESLCMFV